LLHPPLSYLENVASCSQSGANILHERGQGEMIFRYRTNQSLHFSLIQVGVFSPWQKIVYRALSCWL
jgi:hypothetical protein